VLLTRASDDHRVVSLEQTRRLQLAAMGLLAPMTRRARRDDVVAAIERMRLLQIDTIHVVARSPCLVLHSRLGSYPRVWLEEALAEGRLAECWAHEACFVGAADIGWHRGDMGSRAHHWAQRHAERMRREQASDMDALLASVKTCGPVRAADFERSRAPGSARGSTSGSTGWWAWKPEKRWLEAWFALGELMVARRENFQRVYDVSARVLARLDPPFDASVVLPSPAQARQRAIADSVRALGIAQASWIADYFRLKPKVTDTELVALTATGELLMVPMRGWTTPGYVHRNHAELLEKALGGRLRATHTALLSPFDPLVWDRARVKELFDFEYTIECYTPAAKRRYGYFVLPILHRGRFIGRLDAKAHRGEGVFEVKAIYLEPDVAITEVLLRTVAKTILSTAKWHGTPEVRVIRAQPPIFLALLRRSLSKAT
jgi:uncharacterized protein YcaQ